MTTVAQKAPSFTLKDVQEMARDLYGLTVSASEMVSYADQNFHLRVADGRQFVLKIANVADPKEALDLQNKALAHLASKGGPPLWPRVYAAVSGEQISPWLDAGGARYWVRLLSFLRGTFLGDVQTHPSALLQDMGSFIGRLDHRLADFSHPAMHQELVWDLKHAARLEDYLEHLATPRQQAMARLVLERFNQRVAPIFPSLRSGVIHNDCNNDNILVDPDRGKLAGIIDFGDLVHTYLICELAIALPYIMFHKQDPIATACHVLAGYHEVLPLTELELEVLFYLVCTRLCATVTFAAYRQKLEPDNAYLSGSEAPAWAVLESLLEMDPAWVHYRFRQACGMAPCPATADIITWLRPHGQNMACVVDADLKTGPILVFDLGAGGRDAATPAERADVQVFTKHLFDRMAAAGAQVGIGRYNEIRDLYDSDLFAGENNQERRSLHLGIDLFLEPGSPVFAPLEGTVHSFAHNLGALNYGPTIVLQHDVQALRFFTLYGHLSADSLESLAQGQRFPKGARLAIIGDSSINGGWPPHLHFQIIADMLGNHGDFMGVAPRGEREFWLALCPDPNLVLAMPPACCRRGLPRR